VTRFQASIRSRSEGARPHVSDLDPIKGRAKRFAKIVGETVSLALVEDLVADLWPDHVTAAIAAPDPKRGERVILATTKPGATRGEVQAWMKAKGAAEFMHPSSLVVLEAIPVLGSGKTIMWRSATAERNRGSRVSPRANGRLVSTAPPCEVCNRQ
jgi:acyl-CoA synthetase (AMP-forming)/AMP-acid ligase II